MHSVANFFLTELEEGAVSLPDDGALPATVPSYKLMNIAASLDKFLTQLLVSFTHLFVL